MRIVFVLAALAAGIVTVWAGPSPAPSDVPSTHWAHSAVSAVVGRGVMDAPGGRFDGGAKVTHASLAVTLARFARSLQQGQWPKNTPLTGKPPKRGVSWKNTPINRYELADTLTKVAGMVVRGLPANSGKTFGASEGLPDRVQVSAALKSSPAYDSLVYLARNRMLWPKSPLLKPGSQPVTGEELSVAITEMIAGLDDLLTDEPQNREDLGPPPAKKGS